MESPQQWRAGTRDGSVRRDWQVTGLGAATVTVDLLRGARVSALEFLGHDVLVAPTDDPRSPFADGCFAMAPYAGRVDQARFSWEGTWHDLPVNAPPHSAHGVVADVQWTNPEPGVFHADLDDRWPLEGSVVERIQTSDAGLEILLTVGNENEQMPASPGLHPWFNRTIDGSTMTYDLPTEQVYWEDGLITSRSLVDHNRSMRTWTTPGSGQNPVLTWPGLFEISLSSTQARCWVVHETDDGLCVEPQIAPGNALNAGDAAIVRPGEPCTIDLRLTIRSLATPSETAPPEGRALPGDGGTPSRLTATSRPGRW